MTRTKAAWRWVFITAAIIYTATALAAFAYEPTGRETRGGYLSEFINTLDAVNARGEEMRITSRNCMSSCTMYLAADKLCVSRRTRFKFHCAQRDGKCAERVFNQMIADRIGQLDPVLSKWFMEEVSTSKRIRTITGAQMIDTHGAREC